MFRVNFFQTKLQWWKVWKKKKLLLLIHLSVLDQSIKRIWKTSNKRHWWNFAIRPKLIYRISPYLFGGLVTCWKLFIKTRFYFCITILSWHFTFFLFCRPSWMSSKRPSLAASTLLNHHNVDENPWLLSVDLPYVSKRRWGELVDQPKSFPYLSHLVMQSLASWGGKQP